MAEHGSAFKAKFNMHSIFNTLRYGWSVMRIIRLTLGSMIVYQAVVYHDSIAGLIGGLLLFQAVTNTGCCGTNSCATSTSKIDTQQEETNFEEIK